MPPLALLSIEDSRVIYRLPLSVLSGDRVRPALAVPGNHHPLGREHLALELVSNLVGVAVNLLPSDRVLVGIRSTVNRAFPGIVFSVEFCRVLCMCLSTLRIDTIVR